jgi:MYXO-CTERM domain-containing protein
MKTIHAIRLPLFTAAITVMTAGSASATWNWDWLWNNCYPTQPAPTPDECVVKVYADDGHKDGSWKNDKFWSISFLEAVCDDAFIKAVTIDLRAGSDTNAYFDLSGGSHNGSAFGPKIGKLKGLSSSEVSFSPDNGDSSKLTVTFDDGAFKAGDRIWFGADIDNLKNDDAKSVGQRGVGVSVTFGDGSTYDSTFYNYGNAYAKAKVQADDCCGGTVIPTPSAVGLGMLMLGGVAFRRRRSA